MLTSTSRLRLLETIRYTLVLRAILVAHQGRRRDMEAALADLRRGRATTRSTRRACTASPRAWCLLLEEDRPQALHELELALAAEEQNPTIFQLTGRYGLHLLLRVLDGTADQAEYEALTAAPGQPAAVGPAVRSVRPAPCWPDGPARKPRRPRR